MQPSIISFEDWISTRGPKNITVKPKSYPLIHNKDCAAVTIIGPTHKGPWIAGGSVLRWYQDLPVEKSDIDIFCRNIQQVANVRERIEKNGGYLMTETENAITFKCRINETSYTLQIVTKRFFNGPQDIIDYFDISVCQLVHDGYSIYLGEHTACDIREKNLRMSYPLQEHAVRRLTKYWTYGYRPVPGLLETIMQDTNCKWNFSGTEDYQ